MIIELTAATLLQYGALSSRGMSDIAGLIAKQAQEGRWKWLESYTFGEQVRASISELCQLFQDCRLPNWDGYGAAPVSADTFELANQLLEALPPGTSAPSLGAEPDGQLTLEWYCSPRRLLSVSISSEGDLHYAALLGPNRAYGTEAFFGDVPRTILDLIHRVQAA